MSLSKQTAQKLDVKVFSLKKLSELHVTKQYQIKISESFAASGNLNYCEGINRNWENIKENIKISDKERLLLYK